MKSNSNLWDPQIHYKCVLIFLGGLSLVRQNSPFSAFFENIISKGLGRGMVAHGQPGRAGKPLKFQENIYEVWIFQRKLSQTNFPF